MRKKVQCSDDGEDLFEILGMVEYSVEQPKPTPPTTIPATVKTKGPTTPVPPPTTPVPPKPPSRGKLLRAHLARVEPDDQRWKFSGPNVSYQLDDRDGGDSPNIPWGVSVTVPDSDDGSFVLSIKNCPHDAGVEELVEEYGGTKTGNNWDANFELTLTPKQKAVLPKLAKAVRHVVGRKRDHGYHDSNWRWIAGRISEALERFAGKLREFLKKHPTKSLPKPKVPQPGNQKQPTKQPLAA